MDGEWFTSFNCFTVEMELLLLIRRKDPRNSVNILNHSVKVIGGGVGKDKDIIGQNSAYFIN